MNSIEKLASSYIYWPELQASFQKNISFGENKISDFTTILESVTKAKQSDPDKEIIEFYALNEYLSSQRLKSSNILDDDLIDIFKTYQNKVDDLSKKIFCYLLTICIQETKHSQDLNNGYSQDKEEALIKQKYDYWTKFKKYPDSDTEALMIQQISDNYKNLQLNEYKKIAGKFYPKFLETFEFLDSAFLERPSDYTNTMVTRMMPILEKSDITIENLLKTMSIIFKKNSFEGNYGGKAWEKISQHALSFAKGDINAEGFVDQAFSLEHNGGTVFNKEIIFNTSGCFSTNTVAINSLKEKNTISILSSKMTLNMQHAGEILNFLSLNNITNDEIAKSINSILETIKPNQKIKNTKESLVNIFNDLKNEAAHYGESAIVRKILKQNKHKSSTINFESFLGYSTKSNGEKEYTLNQTQTAYLNLAKKVSQHMFQVKPEKPYSKEFIFDAFDICNIPKSKHTKLSLGGKAYGLNQMHKIGLPVPKAVVWTCDNSLSFFQHPKQWLKTLRSQMPGIDSYNKDKEGNDTIVSIRSGSATSMPGMMDTILNVGIDNTNYQTFIQKIGKYTTDECSIKFMKMLCKSYFPEEKITWPTNIKEATKKFRKILEKNNIKTNQGLFPLDKNDQIELSIKAVFQSWHSDRANTYREHQNIENTGTAVIMQHMVFGNLNHQSCTGVIFSRDCINGKKGLIGEFLTCAQGEAVVSGETTPQNISKMKQWNPKAYKKLASIAQTLEEKIGCIQDIEFTIENGQVYILQCRPAISSPKAHIKMLHERLIDKKISFQEFITQVNHEAFNINKTVKTTQKEEFTGLCANPGVIQGICIKTQQDLEKYLDIAKKENIKFILISEETKPEHAQLMIKTDAFLTQKGGFTSHAAILARSWGKPCIAGALESKKLNAGDIITMDATSGKVWSGIQNIENNNSPLLKQIISQYPININHHEAPKINNFVSWRNFADKTKDKTTQNKFTKFLDMGHTAIMKMSMASKALPNIKSY